VLADLGLLRNTQYAIRRCFAVVLFVALAFFLRVHRIDAEGLWIDEAFSVWLARQPLGPMLRWIVRIDQHPPLYYALLHGWMRLVGDSEFAVRTLSALFGTLTVPVIYRLARRIAGDTAGLLAALILAVSPFHVRFAQEARMYALLALEAALALYAVAIISLPQPATPNPKLATVVYILFTATALWTHNTAIFFFLATTLFLLTLHLRTSAPLLPCPSAPLRLCFLAPLLLWLPWLVPFARQAAGVYRRFWLPAPTWGSVAGVIGAFLCDFLPLPLLGVCVVGMALMALALLGLLRLRRRPARAALLTIAFVTPIVGELLVSLWRPIFYARTLIWASLPLYVLMAVGLVALRRRSRLIIVALIALLAVNGLALRNYYVNFEKEAWDEAAALVAERVRPDDLILFHATWGQIPFDYYFRRLYNQPVDEHGVPVDLFGLFERGVLEPPMTEEDLPRLRALVHNRERVWLIYSHDWYTDPQGLIPATLDEELDRHRRWEFHGLRVSLWSR
jgi:uncharacterized membrane protein